MSNVEDQYSTVRIPRELVEETDKLIGKKGFRSRAEIVKEALRRLLQQYSRREPIFECFNLDEKGVLILDRTINRIVRVAFHNPGIWCYHCETKACSHTQFALAHPEIQEILRKEGTPKP